MKQKKEENTKFEQKKRRKKGIEEKIEKAQKSWSRKKEDGRREWKNKENHRKLELEKKQKKGIEEK